MLVIEIKIIVAKHSGFCCGVKRALQTIEKNINKNICMLGEIIHNKDIIENLNRKGVEVINNISEAHGRTVIIRAHGIHPNIEKRMIDAKINFIDCTCPFVKKIQNVVRREFVSGKKIIITGDPKHPEVIAINGYANDSAVIIDNYKQAIQLAKQIKNSCNQDKINCYNYLLVSQTTFSHSKFNRIKNFLVSKWVKICDTICETTVKRQVEAENIAKVSDVMIVLGSNISSNTKKLYELCCKSCSKCFLIGNASDLKDFILHDFTNHDRLGVVVGASTPVTTVKEVISKMNSTSEVSFKQMLLDSFVDLEIGKVVKGTVVQISDNELIVNLNFKYDGIINKDNFSSSNLSLSEQIKVGDQIEAIVLKVNDLDGNVVLSKRKLDLQRAFKKVEDNFNNKTNISGQIIHVVKGGVIVLVYDKVKLFIPASHLPDGYSSDLESYIGHTIEFRVIEFDPERRRYVGSCKKSILHSNIADVFHKIKLGDKFSGAITRIVDFGIFVDVYGISALVHVSEISWDKNVNFKNIYSIGQMVNVFVIGVDEDRHRISLSMKNPEDNPWLNIKEKYPVGKIVTGKIVRMSNYGAFVELEPMIDGLLHISQISKNKFNKITDVLLVGDVVRVMVIDSDGERKRIGLSMLDVDKEINDTNENENNELNDSDIKSKDNELVDIIDKKI
jgi:4-hydroxy-3-methylbut-2-enyl diphosphate reductase